MTNDMNIKSASSSMMVDGGVVRVKSPVSEKTETAAEQLKVVKSTFDEQDKKAQDEQRTSQMESIDKAITSLNDSIQSVQRNLQFSVDKELDKIVISVTDKETNEVVRQIPSEEILDLAKNLQEIVASTKSNDPTQSKGSGVLLNGSA